MKSEPASCVKLTWPSCLVVADPQFRTIEAICNQVREAGARAALTNLASIAAAVGPNRRA
jgi:hypothetical protein